MPRPDRQDEPGALFHIWTRGVARRSIHEGPTDYDWLEERLGHERVQEHMRILAYCLMPNHFHKLAQSVDGNVSEAMRWLKQGHARQFNRKRGRDGPLFQGRFRSRRVHGLPERASLIHYIDHNPVRAGLVATPVSWPFGSARFYLLGGAPEWLATDLMAADVRMLTQRPLDPWSYQRAFYGLHPANADWLIERGMARPKAFRDGWEILHSSDPVFSARWLLRRAELADGLGSAVPLMDPVYLLTELEAARQAQGPWTIRYKGRQCGWAVVTAGLLRYCSGLSHAEIAGLVATSPSSIHNRMSRFRSFIRSDSDFRARAGQVLAALRMKSTGRIPSCLDLEEAQTW